MISGAMLAVIVAVGLLGTPLAAGAQPPGHVWRVGFLHPGSPTAIADRTYVDIFRRELRDLGYVEGQNLTIEYRWGEERDDRLPELALDLVKRGVAVIVAPNNPAIIAAKNATRTIPIVTAVAVDPVGQGLIKSFARPGGNVTGVTYTQGFEVAGKNLELLKEALPRLSQVAGLVDTTLPGVAAYKRAAAEVAPRLGLVFAPIEFRRPTDIPVAFDTMVRQRAEAVYVFGSPLTNRYRREIVALAARHRLPDVYVFREGPDDGGLMSYGVNIGDLYRRSARFVDKILKGARPADLPVEQPTKFELVINAKTAKTLGLKIPPSLLLRADAILQ
jgi:putative ABC transport system substrate-binding protein